MKKLLPILLLLTLNLFANKAILQLDTKGHTALIRDIIVTKSGDIISASDDKTIRIWDSTTGKEKQKILGQIGEGSEGKIFAIALSPNEKFLAVGGFINSGDNERIRIYNYKTGKLLKVLKSHTNIINDLSFSSDGKYLISGSSDKTAKIWSAPNFKLKDTIRVHKKQVYAVKILKKNREYFAVTAGDDNQIALYSMIEKRVLSSHKLPYKLQYLAISKKHIAVCGSGKEIQIYDIALNLITTIASETKPSGLAYSPNGAFLIAGRGSTPNNVNIYSVDAHYKKFKSFKKHTNATIAVNFLDNHTAISAGGTNNEIYIWDSDTLKVKQKIVGVGKSVWSVGVKAERIAWGNRWTARKGKSKLQKTLNLKTMQIGDVNGAELKRIATRSGTLSLRHRKGGEYGYADGVLELKRGGKTITTIKRGATNGYGHSCYGFYKDYIVSGGSNGMLKIYTLQGKEIANLVGHTGEVWSIALDGDRLVSGSDDQTIRVWDLSKLKKQMSPMLNIFVSKEDEWVVWSKSGYYSASVQGSQYVGYHINQGASKEARFVSSDKYLQLYRPDIIEAIVQTGNEEKAIAKVSKKQSVQKVDVTSSLPPMLSLLGESRFSTSRSKVRIYFSVESQSPIQKWIVTRNAESINTKRSLGQVGSEHVTVGLDIGENIISIRAKNKHAMSDAIMVSVTRNSKARNSKEDRDIFKPTLYLLSIGVSDYKNSDYNLVYADKDANSIAKIFKQQEGKIYKSVVVKTLTNSNATVDNILDSLDWIEKESTQKDVVIIFIAGHGENDSKGNYYFLAHDSNVDNLRRTAIKWDEIKDTISALPSKVILLADTCHSGNIMGKGIRGDITGAIKSIMDSGRGAVIMTASTGRGYSMENDAWGHGAFTKAFIEGLRDAKADYPPKNGVITIKEIDLYITNRVKSLTNGKQKPTTIIPESVPDFAIGVE